MSAGTRPAGPPTPIVVRVVGVGTIGGAVLWLLGLGSLAAAGLAEGFDPGASAAGLSLPIAVAGLLFTIGLITLERRAARDLRLIDLVGDLSIATGVGLFVLAAVLGSFAPLGPGLLLFHIGAVLFGAAGSDGRRRPRWASVLVGVGGATLLAYLVLGGLFGPDAQTGLGQGAFIGQLLLAGGWAWLGLHLVLGRPLAADAG